MQLEIDPDKYVVFRRSELFELFGELALPQGNEPCAPVAEKILARVHDTEIHDAVVIRKTDKLAAGALDAYVSTGLTVIEMLISFGYRENEEPLPTLRAILDYFHSQAEDARQMAGHLPTP